jgi:hypothetical protein
VRAGEPSSAELDVTFVVHCDDMHMLPFIEGKPIDLTAPAVPFLNSANFDASASQDPTGRRRPPPSNAIGNMLAATESLLASASPTQGERTQAETRIGAHSCSRRSAQGPA